MRVRSMGHSSSMKAVSLYYSCKSFTLAFSGYFYFISHLKNIKIKTIPGFILLVKFIHPDLSQVLFQTNLIGDKLTRMRLYCFFIQDFTKTYFQSIISVFLIIFDLNNHTWFCFNGCNIQRIPILFEYLDTSQLFSIYRIYHFYITSRKVFTLRFYLVCRLLLEKKK